MNITAVRELGPSAVLALPLGGLIFGAVGLLRALVGIEALVPTSPLVASSAPSLLCKDEQG